MRIREATPSEKEALNELTYGVPVAYPSSDGTGGAPQDVIDLATVLTEYMDSGRASWSVRIKILDTVRQLRKEYPHLMIGRPAALPEVPIIVEHQHYEAPPKIKVPWSFRSDRFRELVKRAVADGWEGTTTGTGHLKLMKEGKTLIISRTSNGQAHAWRNLKAQAKRLGVNVEGL